MGSYFDTTSLTPNQKAAFDATVQDLLRSDAFREALEKAYQQYGTIRITFNSENRTGINNMNEPAILNINPHTLERIFLIQKSEPHAIAAPFTLQRVVAHEIFHFAFDKALTKQLQFRRFADMAQTTIAVSGRAPIEREIASDWDHFRAFFGYEDAKSFTDALLNEPNPLSALQFERLIEYPAIRFANDVLRSLHPESPDRHEGSHTRQSGLIGVAFKTLICNVDQPTIFALAETLSQSGVAGDSEPCAYVHIPGKQQSLAR